MTRPTAGTITLLFTDIEGSTLLLQMLGPRYGALLADHHRLLRQAFTEYGGTEMSSAGDGLYASFPSARSALDAVVQAQRAVNEHEWPDGVKVRVRMGLHTGEPVSGELGYVGLDVHRAARICDAGHGGQILLSRTTRDLVADDLPPGVRLLDLGEHVLKSLVAPEHLYQVVAEGLPRDFPALRTLDARPNNLPRQLTTFIGREREVQEARRILETAPLLTLTGPGGVGKTRIALELAGDLLAQFDGGAWFVELGSLTDPAFVLQAVVSALGVAEEPGRSLLATAIDHLRDRPCLLVLDNCEHVLEASGDTTGALLRACPSMRVLATSREGMGIAGETVFPLPSLSLPETDALSLNDEVSQFEAVRLFAERAMAALPSFRVTDQNAQAVVQICRQLDGMPLAIELAAARVRALTVHQIAARLTDRFRLLTGSGRITVPRHQTLRATIDWSFDLLSEDERAVLLRLSVFAGGCTLEAAEGLCASGTVYEADVLDIISRLVDKSLVIADAPSGEGRFRLLGTIRQYARDQLAASGVATEALRRHRDWFLALVERAAPEFFHGRETAAWLDILEREHENLLAALQWSEDEPGEAPNGLRLAAAMWRFWEIRGYATEGRSWLERMLAATMGVPGPSRGTALTGAGVLAQLQGDYAAAMAFHEQSLEIDRRQGDPFAISYAVNNLANVAVLQGDYARARELYDETLQILREAGDRRGLAIGLVNVAEVVARQGNYAEARSQFNESIDLFREFDDGWGEAFALDTFGVLTAREGDLEGARDLLDQALRMSRRIGDPRAVARTLAHLADVVVRQGAPELARELHRESLAIRRTLGDMPGIATLLERVAWLVMPEDARTAAVLVGAAEGLRDATRAPLPPPARAEHHERLRELESVLGQHELEAARQQGRSLTLDEVVATIPL